MADSKVLQIFEPVFSNNAFCP